MQQPSPQVGQPKKKRSWIDRFMQKDGRNDIKKEIAETEALRKSKNHPIQSPHVTQEDFQEMNLQSPELESYFGGGWRAREDLYRKKIEELTESEIRANIQFYETSDLLVLVKNIRSRKDHAAFRILQRHLEELYLLKHILYERGFYLESTAPGTNNNSQAQSKVLKERRSDNVHIRCEVKTTKNLAEYVTILTLEEVIDSRD